MKAAFVISTAVLLTCIAVPATALSDNKAGDPLYKVVDGYKVDQDTMQGFRTWRSAACDRCHGPNQEGMVGPSLIERLKVLTPEEFRITVLEGRMDKGMPSFSGNAKVSEHIDELYAYLKGRSDGAITRAKVVELEE
ncbi:MAG: cytochrome c [Aromatoleum sp.]|jgi:mono/diheme cytochrome c family protein|uniref:c-type cytochrome n=1 Tax=Aromatoleum sp. TaxID=2307007 RepID=UPI0028943DAA|nr:cytochrome c [Aromatoleum sp.]MDT3672120.1 cytochrome c [Aromatoleum sp.]